MFPFAPTSKLMTTMATSTVTVANVIVQWPFVLAYRRAERFRRWQPPSAHTLDQAKASAGRPALVAVQDGAQRA